MTPETKTVLSSVGIVLVEVGVTVLIFRALSNPDLLTVTRLRVYKTCESVSQKNAEGWAHVADVSRRLYDSSRGVTV